MHKYYHQPSLGKVSPELHHASRDGQLRGIIIEPVVEAAEVEEVAHLVAVAGTRVRDAEHALEQAERAVEREPVHERGTRAVRARTVQPHRL